MNKPRVLIIDDEVQIRKLLQITLESNNYTPLLAEDGDSGLAVAAANLPDLILLDLGLPDKSGHEVLKQLREWYQGPVIILSVRSDEDNIVRALDNTANDYLVKPFRTMELLARIRAQLRNAIAQEASPIISDGKLEIDLFHRTVQKNGVAVKLTQTEFNLLALLAKNQDCVLTHQYLLREVWGNAYGDQTQYVRVFIGQLRRKMEDQPNQPEYILTESGIGYRFVMN